jgi:hypothetical protein
LGFDLPISGYPLRGICRRRDATNSARARRRVILMKGAGPRVDVRESIRVRVLDASGWAR